jgi:CRP-like cAMP-binding protein
VTFKTNHVLIQRGVKTDNAFFLTKGVCRLNVENEVDEEDCLHVPDKYKRRPTEGSDWTSRGYSRKVGPGSIFGHMDILEDKDCTATVVTLTQCKYHLFLLPLTDAETEPETVVTPVPLIALN